MTEEERARLRLSIERIDQSGEESSFAFPHRGAVTALTSAQPGVEQVPEGVTEHVEGIDGNRQEKPRPERQPGRLLHVPSSFPAEQSPPTGNLDGQPKSQEAQRRLGNDDAADVDAEDDDYRRHDIGQDMADQDSAGRSAQGSGCQKIVILFDTDHGASNGSGTPDASGYAQNHNDLEETLAHDGHDS